MVLQPGVSRAYSVFTVGDSTADAFLATGSPTNPVCTDCTDLNFGGAGTLAIAPAGSPKGEIDSVVQWNTTGATAQFNTAFGIGNWHITGIALNLASNFGVQGSQPNNPLFNTINQGNFNIQWISNNAWAEGTGNGMSVTEPGTVTFSSIPTLLSGPTASLGTFTYTPPGINVYVQ